MWWEWEYKKTRERVILVYGLATIISFILLICVSNYPNIQEKKEPTISASELSIEKTEIIIPMSTPTIKKEKIIIPEYSIFDEEIYDGTDKTQIDMGVLVRSDISETDLRVLIDHLYESAIAKQKFKYHNLPTRICIYIYASKKKSEAGKKAGLWIMMLEKDYYNSEPTIRNNNRLIAQLGAKPEVKFGLSEAKRKRIWEEMVLFNQNADKETRIKYASDPIKILYRCIGRAFHIPGYIYLKPELKPLTYEIVTNRTKQSYSGDYDITVNGQTYSGSIDSTCVVEDVETITQRTPLMSPGSTMMILNVVTKNGVVWCYVKTVDSIYGSVECGWTSGDDIMKYMQITPADQKMRQIKFKEELIKNHVSTKYGITLDQLNEIFSESVEKDWDMFRDKGPKRMDYLQPTSIIVTDQYDGHKEFPDQIERTWTHTK